MKFYSLHKRNNISYYININSSVQCPVQQEVEWDFFCGPRIGIWASQLIAKKHLINSSFSKELKIVEARQWSLNSSGETLREQIYKQVNNYAAHQQFINALRGREYDLIFGDKKANLRKVN